MGAYNQVNGGFCCQNGWLLNDLLRAEWGFNGLAISDWSAVHSTELTAVHGVDIEMGTKTNYDNFFLGTPYLQSLRAGKLSVADLDNKVRHRLYVMLRLNLIHEPGLDAAAETSGKMPSTPKHQAVAQRVAEESMVLLKNEGLLPLARANVRTIAVIGGNAKAKFCNEGGSSAIKPPFEITAYAGLTNYLAGGVKIIYAEGYHAPDKKMPWGVAWQEQAASPDAVRLREEAVAAAKMADLVIYVGGLNHTVGLDSESADRTSLKLPCGQDELINQIVAANPKTVVVLLAGAPVEMTDAWLSRVPALLFGWYPGMKGGDALARILFGEVNPSGKLPCTFPKKLADTPPFSFGVAAYPGTNGVATYSEGLLMGYRWYDAKDIAPLYPFGHGLSYTEFKYANLELKSVKGLPERRIVEFDLSNIGSRTGAEVAQIYIAPETPPVFRPAKELKGFQKVFLSPGETQRVAVTLPSDAFAYYDSGQKTWISAKGNYRILVGASSRDIRLRGSVQLTQTVLTKANANTPKTSIASEQKSAYAEVSKKN
jgi:beta-glucosidase